MATFLLMTKNVVVAKFDPNKSILRLQFTSETEIVHFLDIRRWLHCEFCLSYWLQESFVATCLWTSKTHSKIVWPNVSVSGNIAENVVRKWWTVGRDVSFVSTDYRECIIYTSTLMFYRSLRFLRSTDCPCLCWRACLLEFQKDNLFEIFY